MLWLRGRHPQEPPTWRDEVRDLEERVSKWARGQLTLTAGETLFKELWTEHKVTFSQRQHMKCAYCELHIAADPKGGDVEHYRPKAEITGLLDDPTTWGEEIVGHNSRDPTKKRKAPYVCRGYWWLAYDWRNYLLSCGTCNEKWKGNLFPVEGGHLSAPTKRGWMSERALLLNPYDDIDPADHLEFNKIGQVVPRNDSVLGWETIRTCHLGRETLRYPRSLVAKQAWSQITRLLKELGRAPLNERRLRCALRSLLNLGVPRKPHCGMVRILWAQRDTFGFTWKQLRALHTKLKHGSL